MVQKKKIYSLEHTKTTFSSFSKTYTVGEFSKDVSIFRNTIFRINQTPKIKKDFKVKDRYSFNSLNNNDITRNFVRQNSHHINRELSAENNLPGMSIMLNSKIFKGKLDDYLITKELGKGSYAVVKLAVHKVTKIKYAIKIYSKQTLTDRQKRNTVNNEINILKQIDNENIMKLYDVINTPSNLYLVLEYINGVNLLQIIKNEKLHFIKEERAKLLFSKIVKGISYCHKKNIFHRDIKLENVLVLKNDSVKIIDFGFAVKCNRETLQKLLCGSINYMAPEIVKKEKYMACYSDIWSLGVLFYAMLFGIFPFKGKDEDELFEKICKGNLNFPEYNPINEKTKQLFGKIFVPTPNKRISLDEIINMLNE
jgi:serine/threonine protein kinase